MLVTCWCECSPIFFYSVGWLDSFIQGAGTGSREPFSLGSRRAKTEARGASGAFGRGFHRNSYNHLESVWHGMAVWHSSLRFTCGTAGEDSSGSKSGSPGLRCIEWLSHVSACFQQLQQT